MLPTTRANTFQRRGTYNILQIPCEACPLLRDRIFLCGHRAQNQYSKFLQCMLESHWQLIYLFKGIHSKKLINFISTTTENHIMLNYFCSARFQLQQQIFSRSHQRLENDLFCLFQGHNSSRTQRNSDATTVDLAFTNAIGPLELKGVSLPSYIEPSTLSAFHLTV
jgi:hypothetical protein